MNFKNKYLFAGLLLLILSPTAMAAPIFTNHYIEDYSNCSVKLLSDDSVTVSFQANIADIREQLVQTDEPISLSRHNALLSLYFYNFDDSKNTNIQLSDIHNLTLNGSSPKKISNSIQEIHFNVNSSSAPRGHYYSVSFNIPPNILKSIRIGATVGRTLTSSRGKVLALSSKGVSFSPTGHQCASFDPQLGIAPQALKVDPEFSLASAIWQLEPLDLDHLLENTSKDQGLHAPMINSQTNRFCIKYRAMGTQDTRYMISANNINGLSTSGQQFQLIEKPGNNVINYHVELEDTGMSETNISLPKERKSIQLKNSNGGMKKMCWSPKIFVYRTKTTDKGSYSDTLNFTITPQS